MRRTSQPFVFKVKFFMAVLVLCTTSSLQTAGAQQDSGEGETAYEEKLIIKIKEEVMKELREGDFLSQQIELGIQNYINKRQKAQAAARTEAERMVNEKAKNVRRPSASRDHIYGNPDAPISLIEYSDFECPFCKRFHPTPKEIVAAYKDKVNWVYRHFPLSMHNPGAQKEAEASECVAELGGNNAFWKYTDAIYARTRSNGNGFPLAQLTPLGEEIGIDQKRFKECLDSGKYASRVQEDIDEGKQIGVTGTPGNILLHNETGEVILRSGAQPLEVFKRDIERMLEKTLPVRSPAP